jgi:zinc transport system permease protein
MFLETFFPFDIIQYDFMKKALLGIIMITPLLGMLGTMAVNNKMAFFSDALGHSAFTGIALGVLFGVKNDLISMIAFAVLLALIITRVKSSKAASADTVIGVFSSTSIALGLVVLSIGGRFSSYSQYLIGDILSITSTDILVLFICLIAVTIIWGLIYNKLLIISVNEDLAKSRGINSMLIENIFVVLVALVVILSIKWIGILLINSLLILPAASARNISKSSRQYMVLSVLIALVCGIAGLITSFYINTSAGATIVLYCSCVYLITYIMRNKK